MERWNGKIAVVTGASAGIGASIVRDLVSHGLKVAGLARRVDKLKELESELSGKKGTLKGIQCDLTKEEDIVNAFKWVQNNWGPVDVLINNAGVAHNASTEGMEYDKFKSMFDTNLMALSVATREAVKSMKADKIKGHIINISALTVHMSEFYPGLWPYSATKHAVRVLTQGLRNELSAQKTGIRVSSVSPGAVKTDMSDQFLSTVSVKPPSVLPEDVSSAVVYILSTPPTVNITDILIDATSL